MATTEEIRTSALAMSDSERAELARDLLASLEEPESPLQTENEWNEEVLARSDAYRRGETSADDWRNSLARVRDALHARRRSS